ncbi:MAG TPA: trehalase family glycosidase [Mycobacteriales bacterium]|nr:trehalase family glycosidase [Mycobacteriales bacterium]
MSDLLETLGAQLFDRELPFTEPDSRLLVQPSGSGAAVYTAEYERALTSCAVIRQISITDASGSDVPIARVLPAQVDWAGGAANLVFAGAEALSLAINAGHWRVRLGVARPSLLPDGGRCAPGLPSAPCLSWRIEADRYNQTLVTRDGASFVLIELEASHRCRIVLAVGSDLDPPDRTAPHAQLAEEASRRWRAWFDRLPPLPEHVRGVGQLAWWTLAANTLRLHNHPTAPVVVPSKLGYVGHWNWDAYFIAIGLRHGAPELARAQLDLVLQHQRADGMFVDVIHDTGTLAATGQLPADDHRRLASHYGTAADGADRADCQSAVVPVTKPPLLAWAANKLLRTSPDDDLRARVVDAASRNQRWWLTCSDTDGDGLAEYLHPYSSGLDDNPVFDHGAPTATPDLNAYLALQYDELACLAEGTSTSHFAAELRNSAAEHTRRLVDGQWSSSQRRFLPIVRGKRLGPHTITDLLPLITGRLPTAVAEELTADLVDPETFGGDPAVPTVSRADPAYQAGRMWRGPVWLNTNYLLIEALERAGQSSLARELASRTLQLVTESGELAEYWDSSNGLRASRAVPMFSWSAALFLDLALRWGTSNGGAA